MRPEIFNRSRDSAAKRRCLRLLRVGLLQLCALPRPEPIGAWIGLINEVTPEAARDVRSQLGPEALQVVPEDQVGVQVAWMDPAALALLSSRPLPQLLEVTPPEGAFRVAVALTDWPLYACVLKLDALSTGAS